MGDAKNTSSTNQTVTIGGTEYPVTMASADVRERVQVVLSMKAPEHIKILAIGTFVEACLGEQAWAEVLSNYLSGAGDTKGLLDVVKTIGQSLADLPADA